MAFLSVILCDRLSDRRFSGPCKSREPKYGTGLFGKPILELLEDVYPRAFQAAGDEVSVFAVVMGQYFVPMKVGSESIWN